MFTSKPAEAAPVQQAAPVAAAPGNVPNQAAPVTAPVAGQEGQGAVPAAAPTEVAPATPASPLDEFKTLWDTPTIEDGKQPVTQKPLAAEDIQKIVAKTDFSQGITADTLAAITEGGDGAATAFAKAMNVVAQQVMVQSTLVNNKLTEQAVAAAVKQQQLAIPDLLRNQADSDHLKTTNPLFSNSAIKPVIDATQAQLRQKFPNATPAEITTMTQNFIVTMGAEFAPKAQVNDGVDAGTDWEAFLAPPS